MTTNHAVASPALVIFTVGHSTRSFDQFRAILKSHGVQAVADVRQFPRSRRFPHFNDDALIESLPRFGIEYLSFKSLGGRRKAQKDSPNAGWRNEAFRGYADFMQTPEFARPIDELIDAAMQRPTTTMCAEAVPWRCHRSLISDALLIRGWRVMDIFDEKNAKPHALTKFALVRGTAITYPSEETTLF
jgi:uncharacterized protein (DUF488 family)